MPRETVTPTVNTLPPPSEGANYTRLPTVEVGWTRDLGEVQVGLESPGRGDHPAMPIVRALYGDDPGGIGARLIEALDDLDLAIVHLSDHTEVHDGEDITVTDHDGNYVGQCSTTTAEAGSRVEGAWITAAIGNAVIGALESAGSAKSDSPYTGWYTRLDRRAVNALIRLLRKARDASCGRDE